MGVTVHIKIDIMDAFSDFDVAFGKLGDSVVATFAHRLYAYKKLFIKRCADIVGSIIGIIIMSICMIFVAPAIKLDSPGPIFFKQKRVGKGGRFFYIYKFRSMYVDAEERKRELAAENEMQGLMFKVTDDTRITKVGKFLRKTSIDELPQFINVLKGEMSLIGPRPYLPREKEDMGQYYSSIIKCKPGVTGMWQANGRSDVGFDYRCKLDDYYYHNWSVWLDFTILYKTIKSVVYGKGSL